MVDLGAVGQEDVGPAGTHQAIPQVHLIVSWLRKTFLFQEDIAQEDIAQEDIAQEDIAQEGLAQEDTTQGDQVQELLSSL